MAEAGPASDARPVLLAEAFDSSRISAVRHAVHRATATAGLVGQRLDDFVLAVNEIVTNAVRHAGGGGQLRLWTEDGAVCCTVVDTGQGMPDARLNRHRLPPSYAISGRGLWLARHLCDRVTVNSTREGTTVTLLSTLATG